MSRARTARLIRIGAVSLIPVAVSGCAMSPMMALLSTAMEGVSFALSGKSVSDNAISVVAQRDCAFFRVLKGEPVCADPPTPPDGAVQTASADGTRFYTVSARRGAERLTLAPSFGFGDPATVTSYRVVNGEGAIVEYADTMEARVLTLEGFTWRTELYALIQDDGSLEIFAHDPTHRDAGYNIQMVAKIIDYRDNRAALDAVRINGRSATVASIVVEMSADTQG